MKLSRSFLDDVVDTGSITNKELADLMTSVGNEYEEIRDITEASKLVVGEVLECTNHPDSDHLHVCKVNVGETLQIVCGAPNVKAGIKVIVALSGTTLPGGTIKKSTIRGVESNGMLCSFAELGLDSKYYTEEDKKGIHILGADAKIGSDAKEYLGYDDTTIDFELTSNRNDLLSILGMGYEVGAILDKKVKIPDNKINKETGDIKDYISVSVKTDNCPLYLAKAALNVTIKESPAFIKKRLMASGIRPINNVVDISNYVMLLYGQPLHFFDRKTLGDKIIVRQAADKEKITTLDKEERILSSDDIVIANEKEAVCLAGVMGGLNSEIEASTKDIIIESAIFNKVNIRKTSRKILSSESSQRFERGIDPKRTYMAIDMACKMLEEYANATIIKGTAKYDVNVYKENIILITKEKIEKVLGFSLSNKAITEVFRKLDFECTEKDNTFEVIVPSRRLDISIPEDLIEEIGRINGIDNAPSKLPVAATTPGNVIGSYKAERDIKNKLISLGLNEVITYSLVDDKMISEYVDQKFTPYEVLRPISQDKKYMRYSLIPSLMNVYDFNISRKNTNVPIFEISEIYAKDENNKMIRNSKLAILVSGDYLETKWMNTTIKYDYYVLKGIVETLLNYLGYKGKVSYNTEGLVKELHPYSSSNILIDKNKIGFIGRIHPSITKKEIYVCEINITKLLEVPTKPIKNKEISKYPEIKKDVAFIVDENLSSEEVTTLVKKSGTNLLKEISIFDIYTGENVEKGKKSIAYSLTFQSNDKTLEDSEVDKIFRDIISKVTVKLNAEIRDK